MLLGCSGEDFRFVMLPSKAPTIRSAVTVFEYDDRTLAFAGDPTGPLLQTEEGLQKITLLYYASELSDLGLVPGLLQESPEGFCAGYPLPESDAVWTLPALGESFEKAAEPGPRVAQFRFAGPCPCVDFEVESVDMDSRGSVQGLFALGEDHFLVLLGRELVEFRRAGVLERHPTDRFYTTGFLGPDGALWLGAGQGVITRWTAASGFVRTATSASGSTIAKIAGVDELLFAIDERGDVMQLSDGALSVVAQIDQEEDGTLFTSMVTFENRSLLASKKTFDGYLYYREGQAPVLTQTGELAGAFRVIERVRGYGALGATRRGRIVAIDDEGESRLVVTDDLQSNAQRLNTLKPFQSGFLGLGNNGVVLQFDNNYGFCPSDQVDGNINFNSSLSTRDEVLVMGSLDSEALPEVSNRAFFIRPVR